MSNTQGEALCIRDSGRTYGNCICGDDHKFVDCPYANPSLRPPNWQPKREVELELTAKLKNPKLKSAWERAKKETSSRKELKMEASRFVKVNLEGEDIAYSVASHMVSSVAKTSTLRNSVLLDSAATVHVFNDLSRFTDFRYASDEDSLLAGKERLSIDGWGTVKLTVKTETGYRTIRLQDVAYVESFHTNIASLVRFTNKGCS